MISISSSLALRHGLSQRRTPLSATQKSERLWTLPLAGEGIDLIHAIEPAPLVLGRVIREAETALARPLLISD
jgi:hypothetical protein